jgi:hypothetical protein
MTRLSFLNDEEQSFVCFAINSFGVGEHPVADRANLAFFNETYVDQCLERAHARTDELSEYAITLLSNVEKVLLTADEVMMERNVIGKPAELDRWSVR